MEQIAYHSIFALSGSGAYRCETGVREHDSS